MDNNIEYIKEYIGPNYEKIINNTFSWPTFLFSILYFIYRKLYLYTILYLIINAIIIIVFEYVLNLSILSSILSIVLSFIVAFKFKDLYFYKMNKELKKAQEQNLDISEVCKKKGGVNKLGLVIALIIYLVLYGYVSYDTAKEYINEMNNSSNDEEVINLEYSVPNGYKNNYVSDSYASYEYKDDFNECNFIVQIMDNKYESESYYLSNVYKANIINDIEIQNHKWYYIDNQTSYIYALIYKDKLFTLNYYINKDDGKCSNYYNELINTLKINEA